MTTRTRIGTMAMVLVAALAAGWAPTAQAATAYWTGANGDQWSGDGEGGQNWGSTLNAPESNPYTPVNGDSLRWSGASTKNLTNNNDIVGLSVSAIGFGSAPSGIVLNGNKVAFSGNISAGSPTINLPLELNHSGGQSCGIGVSATDDITVNGDITEAVAGRNLWVRNGIVTLNGLNSYSSQTRIGGISTDATVIINTLTNVTDNQSLGLGEIHLGFRIATGTLIYTGGATSTDKRLRIGDGANADQTGGAVFLNNGSGAVIWTGTQSIANQEPTITRNFTLGGTHTGNNTWQSAIGNNGTGANTGLGTISLTKTGAGKWILSGVNTYTGTTLVEEGTLLINGDQSGATGAVSVESGATLGGSGSVGGSVSVPSGATLAVGIDGATADCLTITGTLTLAGNLGIAYASEPSANEYLVATASLIDITGATVTGETRWTPELRNGDTELWIAGAGAGTVIIVR